MQAELMAETDCVVGEGPIWHPQEHVLYFTDIPHGRLYRYDPADQSCRCVLEGRPIAAITIQVDGSLLLFRDRGRVDVYEDGRVTRTLIKEIARERDTRFNDVVADPAGRVFAGTMPTADRPGSLYRFDPDGSQHLLLDSVHQPNGMAFSEDMRLLYQVETGTGTVWQHNYNERTGTLHGQMELIEIAAPARPDGLIVDAEDHLWVGIWGGGCVERYDPAGNLVDRINVEVPNVTSMAFGGPDLTQLFITTALGEGEERTDVPHAGDLFGASPHNAVGRLEFPSRLGLG
ncbi:MAG: SMP-30/gluconolactonase/LRE family protein [Phycisphaeraceae bacterium]